MKPRLTALCLALPLLVSAAARANDWSHIRIATEGAYAPWNFMEASGQLNGFDIDVANDLCARMKAQCDIVAQAWDGIIPALNAGKYDAIVAAMVVTPKRQQVVDFTDFYAIGGRSFIVPKSSPLAAAMKASDVTLDLEKDSDKVQQTVDALKPLLQGKSVGVQVATTHVAFMEKYLRGVVNVREYKTSEEMILDLDAGRIDAALDGVAFLGGTLASPSGQDLTLIGPKFDGGLFGQGSAIAVRKSDTDLRDKITAAVDQARDDGTLSRLSLKWFHVDIAPKR